MPLRPSVTLAVVLCLALPLAACGVAESIAENFVDDEEVVVQVRTDRCATFVRTADGTDVEMQLDTYAAGDDVLGRQALCLLGFALGEGTQLPRNTEIDSVRLEVYVATTSGSPADLGPLVLSHLPGHPDALPTLGSVPQPPGDTIATDANPGTDGWRAFDITQRFLQDFQGGATLSSWVLRLDQVSNGDLVTDGLSFVDPATGDRARLIVRLSLDL